MGADEAALVRLWQEKCGEVEPEDLSGDLLVQLGTRAPESPLVRKEQRAGSYRGATAGISCGASLDGGDP
jgi:hypothetical protein